MDPIDHGFRIDNNSPADFFLANVFIFNSAQFLTPFYFNRCAYRHILFTFKVQMSFLLNVVCATSPVICV